MKKTLNQNQFENMIAECVSQVLVESYHSQRPARKVMNESQMESYIRNIINEELENEGAKDFLLGMFGKAKNDAEEQMSKAGATISDRASQIGGTINQKARNVKDGMLKAGRQMRDKANQVGSAIQNGAKAVSQYGQDMMQAGRNSSAAADVNKLVQNIDGIYQKYSHNLSKSQAASVRSAKSALLKLAQSFGNGVNA